LEWKEIGGKLGKFGRKGRKNGWDRWGELLKRELKISSRGKEGK
jgi:hypothetical protein